MSLEGSDKIPTPDVFVGVLQTASPPNFTVKLAFGREVPFEVTTFIETGKKLLTQKWSVKV